MAENTLSIIFSRFMKPVHVKLPYKAVDFAMAKISRKNNFLKLIDILNDKILARGPPEYNFRVFLVLNNNSNTFKI